MRMPRRSYGIRLTQSFDHRIASANGPDTARREEPIGHFDADRGMEGSFTGAASCWRPKADGRQRRFATSRLH